jgi:methyltransferase
VDVLLVNARRSAYSGESISAPHQGLLSLASVLREATFHDIRGARVEVLDDQLFVVDRPQLPPSTFIVGRSPDIVGVQTVTSSLKNGIRLLDEVRGRLPATLTVLGGVGPTPVARDLVAAGAADVVVRGEGEYAFSSLVHTFGTSGRAAFREVPGITFRDENGGVIETPASRQIAPLDLLPLPARDLVDMHYYRRMSRGRAGNLITSRGCQHACAYCYSRHQWGVGQRRHGVERVIREIEILVDEYGFDRIRIEDDDFLADRQWVVSLCDALTAARLPDRVEWEAKARPDDLDEEIVGRLRGAGCFRLLVGIETLDPQLLRMMSRPVKIAVLERALELLYRGGIGAQATLILGIPGETDTAMRRTLGWLEEKLGRNRHDIVSPCFFVPFHHDVAASMARRLDFVVEVHDTDCYTGHIPVTSSGACTLGELQQLYDDMHPDRRGDYKRVAHLAPLEEVQRRLRDRVPLVPQAH